MTLNLNKTKPPPRFQMWWDAVSTATKPITKEETAMTAILYFMAQVDSLTATKQITFQEAVDLTLRRLGIAGLMTPPNIRNKDVPRTHISSHPKDGPHIPPVHEKTHEHKRA